MSFKPKGILKKHNDSYYSDGESKSKAKKKVKWNLKFKSVKKTTQKKY
jgi:hypothetical protein